MTSKVGRGDVLRHVLIRLRQCTNPPARPSTRPSVCPPVIPSIRPPCCHLPAQPSFGPTSFPARLLSLPPRAVETAFVPNDEENVLRTVADSSECFESFDLLNPFRPTSPVRRCQTHAEEPPDGPTKPRLPGPVFANGLAYRRIHSLNGRKVN